MRAPQASDQSAQPLQGNRVKKQAHLKQGTLLQNCPVCNSAKSTAALLRHIGNLGTSIEGQKCRLLRPMPAG